MKVVTARCLDCGLDYSDFPLDMILPRWQWLLIHPAENGVLCANCMVKRASRIGGVVAIYAVIGIAATHVPDFRATPDVRGDVCCLPELHEREVPDGYDAICHGCGHAYVFRNARVCGPANIAKFCSRTCEKSALCHFQDEQHAATGAALDGDNKPTHQPDETRGGLEPSGDAPRAPAR